MDKSSKIKERILQIADFKGIAKEKFFESISMTYGNFKGKSKLTPINSNAIADIMTIFPEISPEWLLTGKGNMLKEEVVKENVLREPEESYGLDYKEMYLDAKYTIEVQNKYIESLEQQLNTKRKAG